MLRFKNRRLFSFLTQPSPSTASVSNTYADSLGNVPKTITTRLPNGFIVASESNPNFKTATVGIWIDAGSRFETEKNNGTAHFLEHMTFKGTPNRSQTAIEKQIENMGAHLNAYTSREQTVYYAKALSEDVGASVDILADILLNSNLNNDAIERERDVILRESDEIDKMKEEVVFDHLHAIAYRGNPLGLTILGSRDNIKKITREDLQTYIREHYTPDRMVLVGAGGVNHDELVKLATKYFGHLVAPEKKVSIKRPKFVGSELRARYDDHPTAHVVMAVEGASWTSPDYFPLLVAQAIIGSWDRGMASGTHLSNKLVQRLSQNNLANSFTAFNTSYTDTGLFGVYVVSESREDLDDVSHCIQQEWHRLSMCVTDAEVFRAKNQLKTALLMTLDGSTAVAEDIGRQMLTYGKRLTPWEIDGLVESVSAQDVMRVASKYIYDKEVCVVGYGPVESLQDYSRVRSAMSPIYY